VSTDADTDPSPAAPAPVPGETAGSAAPVPGQTPDPNAPVPGQTPDTDTGSIDHRRERIRIETERHRIVGSLTLARDGYRSRVSDVLNAPERDFITLTEVSVEPLAGGPIELYPFLTVARAHIVFAVAAAEETG
jgi:hypothetical protein